MSFETIETSIQDKIFNILLNRPEKRNAFNPTLVQELRKALTDAENDKNVKVIVLKAAGEVFSAGADLSYLQLMRDNTYEANLADSTELAEMYKQIYTLPKPVVAQIEGHAIAGGCGLAAVCDFSIAVPEAQFGYTEIKIGFVPAIVMVFLLRKIGERNARDLLMTGKLVNAVRAKELGLISDVAPKRDIAQHVAQLCSHLIENTSRESLKLTKQMIASVQEMGLDEALRYAAEINAQARSSDDCKNGVDAFLEKRKLSWD